jgi:DNA-binding NarL/FixJ family response regulator
MASGVDRYGLALGPLGRLTLLGVAVGALLGAGLAALIDAQVSQLLVAQTGASATPELWRLGLLVWAAVAAAFGGAFHLALRVASRRLEPQPPALEKRLRLTNTTGVVARTHGLTPRELEVLPLLATALTYQEIGQQLTVSDETVRTHVKSILNKLGQPNRTQAVLEAFKSGLLEVA